MMKKLQILFIALFFGFSTIAFAQTEESLDKQYTVSGGTFMKFDSISSDQISIIPEVYGTYESNLSEKLSGYVRINIIIPLSIDIPLNKEYDDGITKHKAKGFGFTLGSRYYISKLMNGFYIGPSISYYRYNHVYEIDTDISDTEYSITSIRGSVSLGYQYIFENEFIVHIYSAIMLDHKQYSIFTSDYDTESKGKMNLLKPDFGVSIGYHF
jgi:hypothetical protein